MPTYVRLVKVRDPEKIKNDPSWGPEDAARIFAKHGGRVVNVWATLGPYDFVGVVEAPDDETMMTISAEVGARLGIDATTMPAMPGGVFTKSLRG